MGHSAVHEQVRDAHVRDSGQLHGHDGSHRHERSERESFCVDPSHEVPPPPPPPLNLTITANPTSGTMPLTVSFTSSVSGGVAPYQYEWHFGDGAMSPAANTVHIYITGGDFPVWLNIYDSASDMRFPVCVCERDRRGRQSHCYPAVAILRIDERHHGRLHELGDGRNATYTYVGVRRLRPEFRCESDSHLRVSRYVQVTLRSPMRTGAP